MSLRDFATTLGGLVMVSASAAAGLTIWVLLTAPTAVAGALNGGEGNALQIVARALYAAFSFLGRYL